MLGKNSQQKNLILFIRYIVVVVNNKYMKEQRVRKKYVEKQPPDKRQKKPKTKYVAKEDATKDADPPKFQEKLQTPHNKTYARSQKRTNAGKPREVREQPQLLQRISSQADDKLICLICSEGIKRKEPIWTCRQCFISLHLRCTKQWIYKSNEEREKKSKFIFTWSCIQCKNQYKEEMPKYFCHCGKYQNPQLERDLEPHSCGKICQRKRGTFCPHLCPEVCHSGKCKPCEFEGTLVPCNCGKSERMVKCSEERQAFQCGKKCEKELSCKKHKCGRNCHPGPCYPCKKKHMASCFCGKNEDVIDCAETSYGCEEECAKVLDCGFHKCQKLCHPGNCQKCQKTPELQKTCPCGRFELMMLSINERESCSDPIPVCGTPCKKKLNCGHECSFSCHEGKCSNCKVIVQQSCNCGNTHRKIECWKTQIQKDEFKCDKICKQKRSCGIHTCNTQCCKFRNSIFVEDHKCELTCQKMLNCGKHTCGERCHAGNCKKCPVIYSQPQYCPCGQTSIKPPIICGTIAPECENPCNKKMDCGHTCEQLCHYGKCRCYEKVFVECQCGKEQIQTTCGRETLCLNKCQNILKCGHKCLIQCHKGSCEEANKNGCYKKCDKTRSSCGHKCQQICHFGKNCEDFACEAEIMIKCQCGHRRKQILCGSLENSSGKKILISCNKKCQNLKRFDILYKDKQIYYPNAMMQFAFKNFIYLQKLQARLQKFILESEEHFIEVDFKFMGNNQAKTVLHNLFENHYHLNTHFYRHMKKASFTLMQTQNTMIPKPCLSEYIKQVAKGFIKRTNLPFEYTVKFESDPPNRLEMVLKSLKPYLHKYYHERKDKMIHIHFWNISEALEVKSLLESQHPSIQFYGEQNEIYEEEQEEIQLEEIIEKQYEENQNDQKEEEKAQSKNEEKIKEKVKQPKEEKVKQVNEIEKQIQEKKVQEKKDEEKKEEKPKIIKVPKEGSKIIIRKSAPIFNKSQYPPSSENVQDIYKIDEDQLYNEKIDWEELAVNLKAKKMGIEASEWRIRSLILINHLQPLKEQMFKQEFDRITQMYEKDKEKVKRILEIQKIDAKNVKSEMAENHLYLSDHEPQIMAYAILHNYFALDKIQIQLATQCQETRQIQKAVTIIDALQSCNLEEFYEEVHTSDYVLNCFLAPFVHKMREAFLKKVQNKQRFKVQNLAKYLFFNSEEDIISFGKENGVVMEKKFSKTKKENIFSYVSGSLAEKITEDCSFIKDIDLKRDKKYFLTESEELVDDKWMTRSFFAFGDFKESISPKYIQALSKSLKN